MNKTPNQLNIKNLLKTKWAKQFNSEQLYQIKLGTEQDLDVTIYANPIYKGNKMEEIRLGLEGNRCFYLR